MLRFASKFLFAYTDTLAFRLHGPKKTVLVIHPVLRGDHKSRAAVCFEAEEALNLARSVGWDILPGISEPRNGWDTKSLSVIEESRAVVPRKPSTWVTVSSADAESDDELDLDDPLWHSPTTRRQYVESCIVRIPSIDSQYFFGKGKLEELSVAVARRPPQFVFVNSNLTGTQVDELEAAFHSALDAFHSAKKQEAMETRRLGPLVGGRVGEDEAEMYAAMETEFVPRSVHVIDRSRVILEVFSRRAKGHLSSLQVKVARVQFARMALTMATGRCASRQALVLDVLQEFVAPFPKTAISKDGTLTSFPGAPDKAEELHRLDGILVKLRGRLAGAQASLDRQRRGRAGRLVFGLVGYTNVGKTELMNALTGAGLRSRDVLFQTVDSTHRRVTLPSGLAVLLMDTVGFIADCPPFLLDAAILDLVHCDVLLHVRDMAHPLAEARAATVRATLSQAGFPQVNSRIVEVWNKADLLSETRLDEAVKAAPPGAVLLSAKEGLGLDVLRSVMDTVALRLAKVRSRRFTMSVGEAPRQLAHLRALAEKVDESSFQSSDDGESLSVCALISDAEAARFESILARRD